MQGLPEPIDGIVAALSGRSSTDIAATLGGLIRSGDFGVGATLPTVRALAGAIGVSPSTVSDAWRSLREHGLIETDRRRGTTVREARPAMSGRSWHVPVAPGTLEKDLSTGTPDPALLPSLGAALARLQFGQHVTSYLDAPLLPALADVLAKRWPFEAEALTIVDGAQDALDRIISAEIGLGDRVIVETPTFPPLLDMLELAGATVIGVPVDHEGIITTGVVAALAKGAKAIIIQPRAHNPTGVSLTAGRCRELVDVLHGVDILIVEDDHSGSVAGADLVSLGAALPSQTVHIHSFSKSHGPDLRVAAVGGAVAPIDRLVRRRQLGPSWTSRLLQEILLDLLTHPGPVAAVATAEACYAARRQAIIGALRNEGVECATGGSGLNLWVPVHDDRDAVVALAAGGIGVAPGRPFETGDVAKRHIRITISAITDPAPLAAAIAAAAKPSSTAGIAR